MRVIVAVLLLAAVAAFVVLLRTGSGTAVESSTSPGVMIECAGVTGVTDCDTWGDEILAAGSPSTTFEMEDVVRLRLDRAMLGLATTCTAEYYVSRYPDEPIWDEAVECRR